MNEAALKDWIKEEIYAVITAPTFRPCDEKMLLALVYGGLEDGEAESPEVFSAAFKTVLGQMKETGEICVTRDGKLADGASQGYITGTFRANAKGFGFLTPDERFASKYPEDLFVGSDDVNGAMNGDKVTVRVKEERRDSRQTRRPNDRERSAACVITRINERAMTHVVGTLIYEAPTTKKGAPRYRLEPDNAKICTIIHIPAKDLNDAAPGDKVEAEILRYPTAENPAALGRITHSFGETLSREANYDVILHENKIRTEFPPVVLSEAEEQSKRPILPEGRLDLRDKLIFTIDGADSKDLDDAISLERTEDGYLLGVHIADVSEYVRGKSAIDAEAFLRATSVYFADKVIPMLPKELSNGICSLNGGEDRYALSALIRMDENGNIRGCDVRETLICSKIRGVYTELNDILDKGTASAFYEKYEILFPDVYPMMVALYQKLDAKNRAKGALELETTEAKIIIGEDGLPIDIVKRDRGISECMIEQFMLAANEAVALWLYDRHMPCIYRVHEEPPEEKIRTFSTFAYNMGLDVRSLQKKEIRPLDMQCIMTEAKEKGLDLILSTVMLRSLSKAKYAKDQGIHFGLATDFYCHFTSPIRRYPDLTVHRFIKTILRGQADETRVRKMELFAEKSAAQSTECEIRALSAERAIEDLYKVLYMQKHVGEEFDGVISSVTSFGFFVELDNTCEGLVPIASLDGYFTYDENNFVLSCGATQFRLGQKVRVTLTGADLITRKMDMALVEEKGASGKKNGQPPLWNDGRGRTDRGGRTDRTDRRRR